MWLGFTRVKGKENVMKIRVGVSQTINLQNFENIKPTVEVEDGTREDETPEECHERLLKLCTKLMNREIRKINKKYFPEEG